jgi:hypothetical protein
MQLKINIGKNVPYAEKFKIHVDKTHLTTMDVGSMSYPNTECLKSKNVSTLRNGEGFGTLFFPQ